MVEKKDIDWANLGFDTSKLTRDLLLILKMEHGMTVHL